MPFEPNQCWERPWLFIFSDSNCHNRMSILLPVHWPDVPFRKRPECLGPMFHFGPFHGIIGHAKWSLPQTSHQLFGLFLNGMGVQVISPGKKNSWNQINQFHEKKFLTKIHFCNFQKSIFELGKSLKFSNMQFHKEILLYFRGKYLKKNFFCEIDLFDFTSFFGLNFF